MHLPSDVAVHHGEGARARSSALAQVTDVFLYCRELRLCPKPKPFTTNFGDLNHSLGSPDDNVDVN